MLAAISEGGTTLPILSEATELPALPQPPIPPTATTTPLFVPYASAPTPQPSKSTWIYICIAVLGLVLMAMWWFTPKSKTELTQLVEPSEVEAEAEMEEEVQPETRTADILKFVEEDVFDVSQYELPRPAKKEESSKKLSDESKEVEDYAAKRASLFRD